MNICTQIAKLQQRGIITARQVVYTPFGTNNCMFLAQYKERTLILDCFKRVCYNEKQDKHIFQALRLTERRNILTFMKTIPDTTIISKIEQYIGTLQCPPIPVAGGLIHSMYHVVTPRGEYAIKQLNPDIMKRPEALQNMINSEIVADKLKDTVPLIGAKAFNGERIIRFEGSYYMIFDWLDGASVFVPDITAHHCAEIGRILGKIHAADITVESIEKNTTKHSTYDWNRLLETAEKQNAECYIILKDNLSDILRWDERTVKAWDDISGKQVISHRDLDPKNVMWKDNMPYIIDWEAAGYVNPYQELVEVLNYWITEENGNYSKDKFNALMQNYAENMEVNNVNWESVIDGSLDGMLGWMVYNVKRALGVEGSELKDQEEGLQQTKLTICDLKKAEVQMAQLIKWIKECV